MKKIEEKDSVVKKKTYRSPKLTGFGSLNELTLGGGLGPMSDSGMNMMAVS